MAGAMKSPSIDPKGEVAELSLRHQRKVRTLRGLRTWGIAIMVQALLPLCAFIPEYARYNKLSTRTMGAGCTLYVLGLGMSCRDPLVFVGGIVSGFISAVVYGADPNFVDPKMEMSSLSGWLPQLLVIFMLTGFLVDRFYNHVLLSDEFGPFARRPERGSPS